MALEVSWDITSKFDQVVPNSPITVQLEIFNAGASDVAVTSIQPCMTPIDGGWAMGNPLPSGSFTVTAGSRVFTNVGFVFFGPSEAANSPSSQRFTLSFAVYGDDGSAVSSPSEVITVVKTSHTAVAVGGQFLYSSPLNSANWFWF